jgi:hypothetical protein
MLESNSGIRVIALNGTKLKDIFTPKLLTLIFSHADIPDFSSFVY